MDLRTGEAGGPHEVDKIVVELSYIRTVAIGRATAADAERARVAALPQPGPGGPASPDFFRRIPPALGSDLVLMRLRDALAELGGERGRQVHRSWWVAHGAIASVERTAGRIILLLHNGLRVPVSKTYRDQVKEAGWLDG